MPPLLSSSLLFSRCDDGVRLMCCCCGALRYFAAARWRGAATSVCRSSAASLATPAAVTLSLSREPRALIDVVRSTARLVRYRTLDKAGGRLGIYPRGEATTRMHFRNGTYAKPRRRLRPQKQKPRGPTTVSRRGGRRAPLARFPGQPRPILWSDARHQTHAARLVLSSRAPPRPRRG